MSTMNRSKVIDDQSFYDVIAPTLENGPKPVLETSFSKKIFSVILVCVGQCRFTPKTSVKSLEKPEIFVEISRQCNSFIQTWEKFVCYLLLCSRQQPDSEPEVIFLSHSTQNPPCAVMWFPIYDLQTTRHVFLIAWFSLCMEKKVYIYTCSKGAQHFSKLMFRNNIASF